MIQHQPEKTLNMPNNSDEALVKLRVMAEDTDLRTLIDRHVEYGKKILKDNKTYADVAVSDMLLKEQYTMRELNDLIVIFKQKEYAEPQNAVSKHLKEYLPLCFQRWFACLIINNERSKTTLREFIAERR